MLRQLEATLNSIVFHGRGDDSWWWSKEALGLYSVRSAYKLLTREENQSLITRKYRRV